MTDYITNCYCKVNWNLLKESKFNKKEVIVELLNSIISICSLNKSKWESFDYGIRQGVIVESNSRDTFEELGGERAKGGRIAACV